MAKITLKTAKRTTSVNRRVVRDAVAGAFLSRTAPKHIIRKAAKKAAAKKA